MVSFTSNTAENRLSGISKIRVLPCGKPQQYFYLLARLISIRAIEEPKQPTIHGETFTTDGICAAAASTVVALDQENWFFRASWLMRIHNSKGHNYLEKYASPADSLLLRTKYYPVCKALTCFIL